MFRLMTMIALWLVIFNATSSIAEEWFSQLPQLISEPDKKQIPNFESDLSLSLKGSLVAQESLIMNLYGIEKHRSISVKLMDEMLQMHGDLVVPNQLIDLYSKLGYEYIVGKNIKVNIGMGFGILTRLIKNKKDNSLAIAQLRKALRESNHLPDQEFIRYSWDVFNPKHPLSIDELIQSYQQYYAYEPDIGNENETGQAPNAKLFKACENNVFSVNHTFLNLHKTLQDKMIADDSADVQERTSAYQQLKAATEPEFTEMVNLKFNSIGVSSAIRLVFLTTIAYNTNSKHYRKTTFDPSIEDDFVQIFAENMPGYLVYQKLLEGLDLEVLCYQDWLYFKPLTSNKTTSRKIVIPDFISHRFNESTDYNEIFWEGNARYFGQVSNNLPEGKGSLVYFENKKTNYVLSGNFKNGMLTGDGFEKSGDQMYDYSGNYKNGLFHGKGRLIDKAINPLSSREYFKGMKLLGQFAKGKYIPTDDEHYYFVRDPKNYKEKTAEQLYKDQQSFNDKLIKYSGPLKNEKPHGDGWCYLQEAPSLCKFYNGHLIGINGFSLLPGIN